MTKLVFDMASVIQTGLRKGSSLEARKVVGPTGRTETINPAGHGYENAVGHMLEVIEDKGLAPCDVIMVFEGLDSKKRRLMIDPGYKADRGKSHEDYYKEYNLCKTMVRDAFLAVGATAVFNDFCEGDDILGYLAAIATEHTIISTNDGDMAVLRGKNANGAEIEVLVSRDDSKLPDNVFEPKLLTLYKALVGDTSDSIKGVPRFGEKAWEQLLYKYAIEGLYELSEALQNNEIGKIAAYAAQHSCPLLQKIVENWDKARIYWQVAQIHPEWVNTRYKKLQVTPGIVLPFPPNGDTRFQKFHQIKRLVTAETYDKRLEFLKHQIALNPDRPVAFDLETFTGEETDEWLESQGNEDGVDPLTSQIAGFSLTFGRNGQFTYYVSVKHLEQEGRSNVTMKQAREMIEVVHKQLKPIHNTSFELVVLYNDFAKDEDGTLWRDHWKDAGEFGMLPNIEDTLFMASYVDENANSKGLKSLSKLVLGYEQVDFNTMRTKRMVDGKKPYPGGRVVEKAEREPVLDEQGKPMFNKDGKPKLRTVKVSKPVVVDGVPQTIRKRNPETKVMETMPKMALFPVTYKEVIYRMNELPAAEVFDYGCDDTICTMAYYNYAKLMMTVDDHYHVYRKVEIDAAYLHAKNFYDGFKVNVAEISRQAREDELILRKNEEILYTYLSKHGWEGTIMPTFTKNISVAEIKQAYAIVHDIAMDTEEDESSEEQVDEFMVTRVRKYERLLELLEDMGKSTFAWHLSQLLEGEEKLFNDYVAGHFTGRPKFSSSGKAKLMYETMGVTPKVFNKATPKMKAEGRRRGTPKADALAIAYAIMELRELGKDEEVQVLEALRLITMVQTRQGLYYKPYPTFVHWLDNKVHSSHRQCHANTRRASSAKPNMQQMSVHEKIEGYASEFRRVVEAHHSRAVVVSMDFNAQELRVIADDSKDPNMLACYVGDSLKDMHSITGSGIAFSKQLAELFEHLDPDEPNLSEAQYKAFVALKKSNPKIYGEFRSLGKKVNFTTEYGAMAPKLAATLMVSEEEAQLFIDAREAAFAVAAQWKVDVIIAQAKQFGYVRTKLGAMRHLADALDSGDYMASSKAERQAVNFRIQGSCAEMTKLAEGRMWRAGLFTGKYDAVCYGPIHDEVVASVAVADLYEFLEEMHGCMVAPYADMVVPIVSSIEIGPNMYDGIEVGTAPDRAKIYDTMLKLKEKYPEKFNYELGLEAA